MRLRPRSLPFPTVADTTMIGYPATRLPELVLVPGQLLVQAGAPASHLCDPVIQGVGVPAQQLDPLRDRGRVLAQLAVAPQPLDGHARVAQAAKEVKGRQVAVAVDAASASGTGHRWQDALPLVVAQRVDGE